MDLRLFLCLKPARLRWRYLFSAGKASGASSANSFLRASISFAAGIPEWTAGELPAMCWNACADELRFSWID
jgi:hypothetical protein